MPSAAAVRLRLRRLRRCVGLLAGVGVFAGGLVGCGGPAEPASGTAPSTPGPSVSASPTVSGTPSVFPTPSPVPADRVVVDITIADGQVSPSGERVDVTVGQEVELNVTSDIDDDIHAHTDDADGYELAVQAGETTTGRLTLGQPGSYEVESHHLEKTIVILNVR